MAAKNWLIGCGVGCGLIVLVFIGMSVTCGVWLKSATSGFESAVQTRSELEHRFGRPSDFTPPADGAVPADRMEVFLAVREATQEHRQGLAGTLSELPLSEREARELDAQRGMEKARSIFGILGSAFGMIGGMGDFCEARNRAMLEAGMGMGEYTYIYVLAYQSWLGHRPGEGPIGRHRHGDGGVRVDVSEFEVPDRVRDLMIEILENQLRSLPADTDPAWRDALDAELDALDGDRDRLVWEDGVPEAIAASLEPYRERLVTTWEPLTSEFELIRNRKTAPFSYTTD